MGEVLARDLEKGKLYMYKHQNSKLEKVRFLDSGDVADTFVVFLQRPSTSEKFDVPISDPTTSDSNYKFFEISDDPRRHEDLEGEDPSDNGGKRRRRRSMKGKIYRKTGTRRSRRRSRTRKTKSKH